MDVQPTLMRRWLDCKIQEETYSNGKDLLKLKKDRIIANTMADGIVVFSKDKSVFIDQNGNFQSYSRQLSAPIMVNAEFPLMIDGVNFIRQFSHQASQNVQ
jgi:membrane-anchored protein YejM (alkaline phosphatase superfamily)